MRCPYCQQKHLDSERVCPNTGLPLGQQVVCPNCGAEARPGARFCAACGATLPRSQPPTPGSAASGEASDGPPLLYLCCCTARRLQPQPLRELKKLTPHCPQNRRGKHGHPYHWSSFPAARRALPSPPSPRLPASRSNGLDAAGFGACLAMRY
jgi:hypothetical protein